MQAEEIKEDRNGNCPRGVALQKPVKGRRAAGSPPGRVGRNGAGWRSPVDPRRQGGGTAALPNGAPRCRADGADDFGRHGAGWRFRLGAVELARLAAAVWDATGRPHLQVPPTKTADSDFGDGFGRLPWAPIGDVGRYLTTPVAVSSPGTTIHESSASPRPVLPRQPLHAAGDRRHARPVRPGGQSCWPCCRRSRGWRRSISRSISWRSPRDATAAMTVPSGCSELYSTRPIDDVCWHE